MNNFKFSNLLGALVLGAGLMTSGAASAATCSVSDVSLNASNADACNGYFSIHDTIGNFGDQTVADYLNANSVSWGWGSSTWNFLIKDGATTSLNGLFQFSLAATSGANPGSWTLTVQDLNLSDSYHLPLTMTFASIFASASDWGAWEFVNENLTATNAGTFTLNITNKNGVLQGLSHVSLYLQNFSACTTDCDPPPPPQCGGAGQPPCDVPEPNMISLVGLALLGLSAAGLRRRKNGQG